MLRVKHFLGKRSLPGHFALETNGAEITALMRDFLARHVGLGDQGLKPLAINGRPFRA